MAAKYRTAYPSAMKCLTTDAEGLTAYLRFPAEHHKRTGMYPSPGTAAAPGLGILAAS
jgi:hypothetical protein